MRDPHDWVTCNGCSRDVLAIELCGCEDVARGPVCLDRCCGLDHPVGRPPWTGYYTSGATA